MQYYSLGKQSPPVNFKTAAITGQAPDKGLYFPSEIPQFTAAQIERFKTLDKASLAFEVMKPYVGGTIDDATLQQICAETIDFDFPLVAITSTISSLELFHGPTLAFKDVGARFMSRCLGYFSKQEKAASASPTTKSTTVLVATSGDTGGAVANGFLGVEGVNVIILYPKGKVSQSIVAKNVPLGKTKKIIPYNIKANNKATITKKNTPANSSVKKVVRPSKQKFASTPIQSIQAQRKPSEAPTKPNLERIDSIESNQSIERIDSLKRKPDTDSSLNINIAKSPRSGNDSDSDNDSKINGGANLKYTIKKKYTRRSNNKIKKSLINTINTNKTKSNKKSYTQKNNFTGKKPGSRFVIQNQIELDLDPQHMNRDRKGWGKLEGTRCDSHRER